MKRFTLLAMLVTLAPSAGAQSGGQSRAIITRGNPSVRPLTAEGIVALKAEIDALDARQLRLDSLWQREVVARTDPRRMEVLEDSLVVGIEALLPKQSQLRMSCALLREDNPFLGWVGVAFEQRARFTWTETQKGVENVFVKFGGGARVAEVEIGSPAEKAGVLPGDEWLALNGRFIRDSVAFDEIDKPGVSVAVRTLRVGREVENTLTVAKNPRYPVDACAQQARIVFAPTSLRMPQVGPMPGTGATPRFPAPPGFSIQFLGQNQVFYGGATLGPLTADKREILKAVAGVVVMDVPEGTPAAVGGLRSFDVIIQVNGADVASLADFRRLLAAPGSMQKFTVQREGKTRVVTLGPR